jgi:hypothetical protein
MAEVNIADLAEIIGVSERKLLTQIAAAGLPQTKSEQVITTSDKNILLQYLRRDGGSSKVTLKIKKRNVKTGHKRSQYTISDSAKIEQIVKNRNIKYLVHFTRADNLSSILQHGLRGIVDLSESKISYANNDQKRLDRQPTAICLSISFPNYLMFFKLRNLYPNVDWIVLRLKPEVLWKKSCLFCTSNAASSDVVRLPIKQRLGSQALEKMFGDNEDFTLGSQTQIPTSFPTNPQAEVLVLNPIEPNYFIDAFIDIGERIQNGPSMRELTIKHDREVKFVQGSEYFVPRMDYEHWKNK